VSFYIYLTLSPFWFYILTMKPAYIFLRHKLLRLVSIAGSTSYTGIYYALVLALAAQFEPLWRTRTRRIWGLGLVGLLLSCIALTFNRGTWVGVLLGVTVLTVQGHISRRRVTIAMVLGVSILILMATTLFGQIDLEQQMVDFVHYSRSSADARLVRWISAVNVILDHPLLGVGYNNYAFVYGKYSIIEGLSTVYGSPHNMFVDVITGTGFIGFVVFMMVMARLWRQMQDNLKAALPKDLAMLARGVFLAFLFFIGSSLFDSFIFKPHHSSYVIFLIFAMSTAIKRLRLGLPPEALPAAAPAAENKP
jgi:putative inorganic carbon (hco3(-)) transporter